MSKALRITGLVVLAAIVFGSFATWLLRDWLFGPGTMPAAVYRALDRAQQVELLSLDPGAEISEPPPSVPPGTETFHGWPVIGKTFITDSETRNAIVTALCQAAREAPGMPLGCFNPRHGLRLVRDGQVVDLIICFHCYQVEVYWQNQQDRAYWYLISGSPQSAFDQIFRAAGLPLAKPASQ